MSAGGSLRSPGVTLVNYKGDNISKYARPTVRSISPSKNHQIYQFVKFLMSNDDVITK